MLYRMLRSMTWFAQCAGISLVILSFLVASSYGTVTSDQKCSVGSANDKGTCDTGCRNTGITVCDVAAGLCDQTTVDTCGGCNCKLDKGFNKCNCSLKSSV